MLFSALSHRKPYFVPVCCCYTWFSGLFAENWLIFAWSHLKQCFYCFVSKFRFFRIFLHWIKNLAFLKLVTLILAIPQSKEGFLLFWVQITLLQDFFHGIKVLACFQLITLILAIFHAKKCFCCCGAKLRCVQLFRTGNGFCLFGANRAVLSCFGSLLPYFQLFCTWKRFSPVFFFWCLITLLSALSHGKDFSLSCRWI